MIVPPRDAVSQWEDLFDLVGKGRAALALPIQYAPRACMDVLPEILDAMERVALYKVEIVAVKADLAAAVTSLREAVERAEASHFDVAAKSAQVKRALQEVSPILDRLDRLIYGVP